MRTELGVMHMVNVSLVESKVEWDISHSFGRKPICHIRMEQSCVDWIEQNFTL